MPWRKTLTACCAGRAQVVGWLVLLLVCAALFGSTVHEELGDLGGDSAAYILLAQSIATGHGYRDLSDPMLRPHTKYPPLFPAMLAPLVKAFGPLTFRPMHALVAAWAVAAVLLTVALFGALGGGGWVAAVATAGHPWVVHALLCVWSEFPYLALSLLALYALQRYRAACDADPARAVWRCGWLWLAATVTAAAVLTRTIGWALVAAGVCGLWPGRAWRSSYRRRVLSAWLLLALAPLAVWAARSAAIGDPAPEAYTYWQDFQLVEPGTLTSQAAALADVAQRVLHNTGWYARLVGDALGVGIWPLAVRYVLAVCALWGWWLARRQADLAAWYLLWYMGVLIAYPWNEGGRFLLPVIPFWWYGLWRAASWGLDAARRIPWPVAVRTAVGATLGVTLAGQWLMTGQVVRRQHQDFRLPPPEVLARLPAASPDAAQAGEPGRPSTRPAQRGSLRTIPSEVEGRYSIQWARVYGADYYQLAGLVRATEVYAMMDWIRRHVHEPTVILWRARPSIMTLFANQPSVNYPWTDDPTAWHEAVRQPHPVLLLAERYHPASGHLWPLIAAHPDVFTPVHTIGAATLFRVTWPHHLRGRPEGD